jgi:hypothetical protein
MFYACPRRAPAGRGRTQGAGPCYAHPYCASPFNACPYNSHPCHLGTFYKLKVTYQLLLEYETGFASCFHADIFFQC